MNNKLNQWVKQNKRYLIELCIILLVLGAAAKIVKIIMVYPTSLTYKSIVVTEDEQAIESPNTRRLDIYDNLLELKKGDIIEQSFTSVNNYMTGIQLVFLTDGDLSSEISDIKGDMDVTVTEKATGSIVASKHYDLSDIKWIENNFVFVGEPIEDAYGKEYIITITVNNTDEKRPVYVDMTKGTSYSSGNLLINGIDSKYDLVLSQSSNKFSFLLGAYAWIVVIFIVMVLAVYYMMRIRKSKIENVYLVLAICIGILYMAFLPPYTAPDDQTHLNNSYNYSNILMGTAKTGSSDTIYMRKTDTDSGLSHKPTITEYERIYKHFFEISKDNTLQEVDYNQGLNAAWYCYIPGTLGITFGRLCNMGGVATLYMGTIFSYIAFVLAVYFCIKKAKSGKMIYMAVALLPMVMQQAASYSYDVTLLIIAFIFTTICMNLFQEDSKLKIHHMVLILILSFLFIKIKMGAYLPLCLIVLLINKKAYKNKKIRIISITVYFAFCLLVFLSGRLGYFTHISGNGANMGEAAGQGYANYIAWAGSEGYTIGYLLHTPWQIVKVLINTFQSFGSEYVEGMIANPIGWVNYGWYYPNLLVYGFAAVLIMASLARLESTSDGYMVLQKTYGVWDRIWVALAILGTMGCIIAGMWFSWTPISFNYVVGVQGRYFLPVLPLILMFITNKTVVTKKSLSGIIVALMIILHTWAFWTIGCAVGMVH